MGHEVRYIVFKSGDDCRVGVELESLNWERRIASTDIEARPSKEVEFASMVVILLFLSKKYTPIEIQHLRSCQSREQKFVTHVVELGI